MGIGHSPGGGSVGRRGLQSRVMLAVEVGIARRQMGLLGRLLGGLLLLLLHESVGQGVERGLLLLRLDGSLFRGRKKKFKWMYVSFTEKENNRKMR